MNNIFYRHNIISYIFVLLALTSFSAKAQIDCQINIDGSPAEEINEVCYGQKARLSVEFNPNYQYEWVVNGNIVDTMNQFIDVKITDNNTICSVTVTDEVTMETCSNSVTFSMHPRLNVVFKQLKLTCSDYTAENGNTGKMRAYVEGDTVKPYKYVYDWQTPYQETDNPQVAIALNVRNYYYIKIKDPETGCEQTDSVKIKSFPNPRVNITSLPKDTVYVQKPYATWSFENTTDSIDITNFFWKFRDEQGESYAEATPTFTYLESDYKEDSVMTFLTVTSDCGCDTTFARGIKVLPVKLKIPNIFTPNGDGKNDYFIIGYDETGGDASTRGKEYEKYVTLSDYFISHKLTIFNRWGRIVFKSTDYKNDWDGGKLPDGTYFYVLECVGKYEPVNFRYQGSVMIWGSGR